MLPDAQDDNLQTHNPEMAQCTLQRGTGLLSSGQNYKATLVLTIVVTTQKQGASTQSVPEPS